MGKIAIDFGTGNTLIARHHETENRLETLALPGISTPLRYRLAPGQPEHQVAVIPSMIHYTETEILIGDQVLSRGLAEQRETFRWIKRSLAQASNKSKKTAVGHKTYREAGTDFLRLVLNYISDQVDFAEDEFTFTLPVEAFENFQSWLEEVADGLGLRRVRFLDEPTACVLGYHGIARHDERFLVFDFGCGTLDVSAVRIDLSNGADIKAVQLGKAGEDLGGMDIDRWLADDFCARHGIAGQERRDLEAVVERRAEQVKIALSDPDETEAELSVPVKRGAFARLCATNYRRVCRACAGAAYSPLGEDEACLGCLLLARRPPDGHFLERVGEALDRALENAAINTGMRRGDITRVLATGGTSLVPAVVELLQQRFGERLEYAHPFDAVAQGACQGIVLPILQHDYAIESRDPKSKRPVFKPFLRQGTEYPTAPDESIHFTARGSYDGQETIGVKVYEVSQLRRRSLDTSIVGADGVLRSDSGVNTDREYILLNAKSATYITADPKIALARDRDRFQCRFCVDGNRRLLITVEDYYHNPPKLVMKDYPVVRL